VSARRGGTKNWSGFWTTSPFQRTSPGLFQQKTPHRAQEYGLAEADSRQIVLLIERVETGQFNGGRLVQAV
jgi:hypothetical protein